MWGVGDDRGREVLCVKANFPRPFGDSLKRHLDLRSQARLPRRIGSAETDNKAYRMRDDLSWKGVAFILGGSIFSHAHRLCQIRTNQLRRCLRSTTSSNGMLSSNLAAIHIPTRRIPIPPRKLKFKRTIALFNWRQIATSEYRN